MTRRMRADRVLATSAVVLALVVTLVKPSLASSVGWPPRFWDANNDSVPNNLVAVCESGTNWTNAKRDAVDRATSEWMNNTTMNLSFQCPAGAYIYVNGHEPWCVDTWENLSGAVFAVTCDNTALEYYPGGTDPYLDIGSAMMTVDNRAGRSWYYGTGGYSSGDPASFQGIVTHELGHIGGLRHETTTQGCPYPITSSSATMCGNTNNQSSYWMRSLENVDINSADSLY